MHVGLCDIFDDHLRTSGQLEVRLLLDMTHWDVDLPSANALVIGSCNEASVLIDEGDGAVVEI